MNGTTNLEIDLQQKSREAIKETAQLGETALPTIEKYSRDDDYQKRQIAVACAGVIKGDSAASILTAGLDDANINVRLEAAKAINRNPNPGVTDAVLEKLESSQEEVLKQTLALAAGKLPGERIIEVLKKVQQSEEGVVAANAQMAQARLGDSEAKEAIVKQLSDEVPGIRYHALEKLIYIKDRLLASYARRLLEDKTDAVRTGTIKSLRYRRVCDQAVETVVFLMTLSTTFRIAKDRNYNEQEIQEVREKSARG